MPHLLLSERTSVAAGITAGDWIQIVVAVLALFGGAYAGATQVALSRMHVEDRRRILALAPVLAIAARPYRDLHLPGRESFSLEYASPLPRDRRAIVSIDQVELVMDHETNSRLSELEEGEAEVENLAHLLPLWDRLSYRRFRRGTAATRALAKSLHTGRYVRIDEEAWVVSHGPGGDSGCTRIARVSLDRATAEWTIGDGICSFRGPSLPEWRSYEYRVGPVNTSGGDFLCNGVFLDWAACWDDFAAHLRRQLRPGRWRDFRDKLYRVGLLRDWALRRL